MSLTTRVLPVDEWGALPPTDLARLVQTMPNAAERVTVLVVERDAQIVAMWGLFDAPHVEGVWIAPSERKHGSVLRRGWKAMRALLSSRGISSVLTSATTEDVKDLIVRLGGVDLGMPLYALNFSEDTCRSL